MRSKTILNICLKVVGVYYALNALNMLPSTISQLILTWDAWKYAAEDDPMRMMINYKLASVLSILIPILLFVLALIIIFKSESIVNFLLKDDDASEQTLSDNLSDTALDISIKIFGFFSFLSSIPHLSKLLSRYWIMKGNIKLYDNTGKIELVSSAISVVLYILVGFLLIYYSKPLSQRLLRIESISASEKDSKT